MRTPDLYVCAADSAHFEFQAFGRTAAEARAAFLLGIREHCAQTGAEADWADSIIAEAQPRPHCFGDCLRDDFNLTGPDRRS